ncbi:MAG: DUF3343 domain-containing protein [Eubacteriales bacterium]
MDCRGEEWCTEFYILVRTATYAQSVIRLLNGKGIKSRQAKSPVEINRNGCGYAVAVKNSDPESLTSAMEQSGLPNFKIYSTSDGRTFHQIR